VRRAPTEDMPLLLLLLLLLPEDDSEDGEDGYV
jgi:hypothetical protein